jgi:hypothetical protein
MRPDSNPTLLKKINKIFADVGKSHPRAARKLKRSLNKSNFLRFISGGKAAGLELDPLEVTSCCDILNNRTYGESLDSSQIVMRALSVLHYGRVENRQRGPRTMLLAKSIIQVLSDHLTNPDDKRVFSQLRDEVFCLEGTLSALVAYAENLNQRPPSAESELLSRLDGTLRETKLKNPVNKLVLSAVFMMRFGTYENDVQDRLKLAKVLDESQSVEDLIDRIAQPLPLTA